jgi:hypothetical protein
MEGKVQIADGYGWAEEQFGEADLGDVRRTRRLVKLGAQMAGNSSGTIPQQTGRLADMKAAYRLFAQEAVTHEAICMPHWQRTREETSALPVVFLIQDTTELDFTYHSKTRGLAPIGNGGGRGLHQQNVLAVDPARKVPIGLMYQRHHRRQEAPDGETRLQRRQRPLAERESFWWVEAIRSIGSAPQAVRWVHILDRGGDAFAVYDAIHETETDFIIRAAQDRQIVPNGHHGHLFDYVRSLPSLGERELTVRVAGSSPRKAMLKVASGTVMFLPSSTEPELCHRPPVSCQVVRVWEDPPPCDAEGLEWILLTSLPTATFEQAGYVSGGYALRWLVEELHKSEKTGCRVEERQLRDTDRLEPLIGLLSVLAVRLLELKFVAREEPDRLACDLFGDEAVQVMARYLECADVDLTVGVFWRGIGRLGGHPGRKRDGPLGWLRAWRGWQAFQLILLGASLFAPGRGEKCG